MDHGALIRDGWRLTWRYRFLWVLGLFAGSTVGFSGWGGGAPGWRQPRQPPPTPQGDTDVVARTVTTWVENNIGLVAGLAAGLALLGLAVLVGSLIAQGAMARATADLARGRASSLGLAWRARVHPFWRYLGLWLLLIGIALGVALVIGLAALSAVAAIVVGVVLFVPLILLVIGLGVAGLIVIAYAQRAIAVDNVGPATALREGWELLRAHPGASLLICLLNFVLSGLVWPASRRCWRCWCHWGSSERLPGWWPAWAR